MLNKILDKIKSFSKSRLANDSTVVKENIAKANRLVSIMLLATTFFLLVTTVVIHTLPSIQVDVSAVMTVFAPIIAIFGISGLLGYFVKSHQTFFKWFLNIVTILGLAALDFLYGYHVALLIVIPLIISARYSSNEFTIVIIVLSIIFFTLSGILTIALGFMIDLNIIVPTKDIQIIWTGETSFIIKQLDGSIDIGASIGNYLLRIYLPKMCFYLVIALISFLVTKHNKLNLVNECANVEKETRNKSELELATHIQLSMLPSTWPAFPDNEEFDIYATMNAAKEVGGDFYDTFKVDNDHVAFLIADVSGKGVPAALFMSRSMTLLKDYATLGFSPKEIFNKVNNLLLENNDKGLFVTAWLGVLNIKTGELVYANAGHNKPLISKNGVYEFINDKANFFLAGKKDLVYTEHTINLNKGDRIFLYTDGVTEANDKDGKMFGNDRLLAYLNASASKRLQPTLKGLKSEIDAFSINTDQFDDITMLILEYKGSPKLIKTKKKTFKNTREDVEKALNFIKGILIEAKYSEKIYNDTMVCFEEVFLNISSYAYTSVGSIEVIYQLYEDFFTITFVDSGIKFNPLSRKINPLSLKDKNRKPGGLGIVMVKEIMDKITYHYEDNKNILLIKKNIK